MINCPVVQDHRAVLKDTRRGRMKKSCILCTVMIACLYLTTTAWAQNTDVTFDYEKMSDTDQAAIFNNEADILKDIKDVLDAEKINVSMPENLVIEDYAKIFIDNNIFSLESTDYEAIKKSFEDGSYVYECLIKIEDIRLDVTLGIRDKITEADAETLSEEEFQEIRGKEGKWCVSAVTVLDTENFSYVTALKQKDLKKIRKVTVFGMTGCSIKALQIRKDSI